MPTLPTEEGSTAHGVRAGAARGLSRFGGLVSDPVFQRAVTSIVLRSDQVSKDGDLEQTYVDVGVRDQLDNGNDQIVFGRRGTGKSHILRMLSLSTQSDDQLESLYFDLRLIGSASIISSQDSITEQCLNLFRDILDQIHDHLFQRALESGVALEKLDQLHTIIHAATSEVQSRTVKDSEQHSDSRELRGELSLSSHQGLGATLSKGRDRQDAVSTDYTYDEILRDSLVFASVSNHLVTVLEALGIDRLFVLLDECASLPLEFQPYLAEYPKRSLLPCNRIALKIAALSFRSRFATTVGDDERQVVGLELGGDIAANVDIDDFYIFDKSPDFVTEVFLKILYLHLFTGLPSNYLELEYRIRDAATLRQNLFDSVDAFSALIRAAEGVVRDFCGILTRAIQIARVHDEVRISVGAVENAAAGWYEDDKVRRLTGPPLVFLNQLTSYAIRVMSRYFLVDELQAESEMVGTLVDQRVLHLLRRGYMDHSSPGGRFNLYALDYGTFVRFGQGVIKPMGPADEGYQELMSNNPCILFGDDRIVPRVVVDLESM